jgi:hypothetical protein
MELHLVWTFRFPYLASRYMLWTANFVITIFTLAPLRVLNSNIGLRIHTQILTCVANDDQLTKEQGPFSVGLISGKLSIDILTACVLPTHSSSELLNDPWSECVRNTSAFTYLKMEFYLTGSEPKNNCAVSPGQCGIKPICLQRFW